VCASKREHIVNTGDHFVHVPYAARMWPTRVQLDNAKSDRWRQHGTGSSHVTEKSPVRCRRASMCRRCPAQSDRVHTTYRSMPAMVPVLLSRFFINCHQ
jgi:hypothetical protein